MHIHTHMLYVCCIQLQYIWLILGVHVGQYSYVEHLGHTHILYIYMYIIYICTHVILCNHILNWIERGNFTKQITKYGNIFETSIFYQLQDDYIYIYIYICM